MSSGLFNVGLSALLSAQKALRTTGHNVANVSTPGYSRQSVSLVTRPPQGAGDGFVGTGVSVATVTRELNAFLSRELRSGTAGLSQSKAFHELASRVDHLLADSAGGLSPSMQQFFAAMHEVAADPSSVPARQVLLAEAQGLVQRFHTVQRRLDEIRADAQERLRGAVEHINGFAAGIARINDQLIRQEAAFAGQPANDLRDQRDELIRQLSERIDVTTFVQSDGAVNVMVGSGQGLVVGTRAARLDVAPGAYDPSESTITFTVGGATTDITRLITGGELAGVLRFRTEVLATAQQGIGHLAMGLAETLNEQHSVGQTLGGSLGGDLFSPLGESAPATFGHRANAGVPPGELSVGVTDVRGLPTSDYRLERAGGAYRLTRLADGTVFDLAAFPAMAEEADGLRLELTAGAIADGDSFLIQPTRTAARRIGLAFTAPAAIAAAAPVRSSSALANTGDAVVSAPRVNLPSHDLVITFDTPPATFGVVDATTGATLMSGVSYVAGAPLAVNGLVTSVSGAPAAGDRFTVTGAVSAAAPGNGGTGTIALATIQGPGPALTEAVTITFTSPTTYDVSGATSGPMAAGVSYTSGAPLSFNGWTVAISGSPRAGDTFSITANTGGVGDNRNALALAALQTTGVLGGGRSTYQDIYGQLVAGVGAATRQADLERGARSTLLEQLEAERETVSGVNLDEEAANLLRFQQAYQASARLISVADELIDTLIGVVGR